ncbi:DUF7221 family queuine tRNA-ribosyltransferase-like protein [Actinoplanes sp. URMC 104]|uniref:deazapurine DNA modification protein DpdA family protein n=1 Tax=Actinoplanes sp. URMC 104 TaxID=3423409 RepID=UPI003F1A0E13
MSTAVEAPPYVGVTFVIPCGGQKLDRPAPARELYRGQMFRQTLDSAIAAAADYEQEGVPARVLILSGLHGLVELDTVLAPYEQRIDKPGAVAVATLTGQALELGITYGSTVIALLPQAYFAKLNAALRELDVLPYEAYEGTAGNGEQRRVNAIVAGAHDQPAADGEPERDGMQVWVGADVDAFWWKQPQQILVSAERLARLKTLPVARTWWVLDSGAYKHLQRNGRWTVSAAQYAADIRRWAAAIGKLRWAAPQDWPAAAAALAATGLTEYEHQLRTLRSVLDLRAAGTGVHIIPVLTGLTVAGYLRHMDMYRRAGIDLTAEPLVGVGALLGRPYAEQAEIVRVLHAAGVTRMHAFGGKNQLVAEVGHLLTSIDSAGWSDEARRTVGRCTHGQGVEWEANCPQYAADWARGQRELAAQAPPTFVQTHLWDHVLAELAEAI